jgi:hypothetical protein
MIEELKTLDGQKVIKEWKTFKTKSIDANILIYLFEDQNKDHIYEYKIKNLIEQIKLANIWHYYDLYCFFLNDLNYTLDKQKFIELIPEHFRKEVYSMIDSSRMEKEIIKSTEEFNEDVLEDDELAEKMVKNSITQKGYKLI